MSRWLLALLLLPFASWAHAAGSQCRTETIDAVQSRIYQAAIVEWCGLGDLNFESIGKGNPTQTTSSIMNLDGRLFDFISQKFHDRMPIPADVASIYGEVFCAALEGQ